MTQKRMPRLACTVMIVALGMIVPSVSHPAQAAGTRSHFPIPPLARTVAGVTVSAQTGQVFAGAKVVLTGNRTAQVTRSDSNGLFQFTGLAPGSYLVRANGGPFVSVTVAGYDSFITLLVD